MFSYYNSYKTKKNIRNDKVFVLLIYKTIDFVVNLQIREKQQVKYNKQHLFHTQQPLFARHIIY